MKLECISCYLSSNNIYSSNSKWNNMLQCFENDVKEWSKSIRIFGTQEEIDEALNQYCNKSGLDLDDAFDFTDIDKLKEYKKQYKNKGLIINLI